MLSYTAPAQTISDLASVAKDVTLSEFNLTKLVDILSKTRLSSMKLTSEAT
jgi:hypothetical protein